MNVKNGISPKTYFGEDTNIGNAHKNKIINKYIKSTLFFKNKNNPGKKSSLKNLDNNDTKLSAKVYVLKKDMLIKDLLTKHNASSNLYKTELPGFKNKNPKFRCPTNIFISKDNLNMPNKSNGFISNRLFEISNNHSNQNNINVYNEMNTISSNRVFTSYNNNPNNIGFMQRSVYSSYEKAKFQATRIKIIPKLMSVANIDQTFDEFTDLKLKSAKTRDDKYKSMLYKNRSVNLLTTNMNINNTNNSHQYPSGKNEGSISNDHSLFGAENIYTVKLNIPNTKMHLKKSLFDEYGINHSLRSTHSNHFSLELTPNSIKQAKKKVCDSMEREYKIKNSPDKNNKALNPHHNYQKNVKELISNPKFNNIFIKNSIALGTIKSNRSSGKNTLNSSDSNINNKNIISKNKTKIPSLRIIQDKLEALEESRSIDHDEIYLTKPKKIVFSSVKKFNE